MNFVYKKSFLEFWGGGNVELIVLCDTDRQTHRVVIVIVKERRPNVIKCSSCI